MYYDVPSQAYVHALLLMFFAVRGILIFFWMTDKGQEKTQTLVHAFLAIPSWISYSLLNIGTVGSRCLRQLQKPPH